MTTPNYAKGATHTVEITDAWREISDPENEHGETCLAFFEVETVEAWTGNPRDEINAAACRLVAIAIDDGRGLHWRNREQAIQLFGDAAIARFERIETEHLNSIGWAA